MKHFRRAKLDEQFYGRVKFSLLVDFVIPAKGQSLLEAYGQWRERADAKVCCDYGLHAAITSWDDQVAKDMETLTKEKGLSARTNVVDRSKIVSSSRNQFLQSFHGLQRCSNVTRR